MTKTEAGSPNMISHLAQAEFGGVWYNDPNVCSSTMPRLRAEKIAGLFEDTDLHDHIRIIVSGFTQQLRTDNMFWTMLAENPAVLQQLRDGHNSIGERVDVMLKPKPMGHTARAERDGGGHQIGK